MSLIDFPNIPPLPGVPDLRRSGIGIAAQTGIMGKLQGLDYFGLLDGLLAPTWQIVDVNGAQVIKPDSVVAFEYRGEARLANFPLEQGSFSTYNKVQMPYDIRMRMTCGGNGSMSRSQFLAMLSYLQASTDLYTIVTPDETYVNVNLASFDFRREARNGVTLITADAMFQEIRVTATGTYVNAAQPSGADQVSVGSVKTADPTPAQTSKYNSQDTINNLRSQFPNAKITVDGVAQ